MTGRGKRFLEDAEIERVAAALTAEAAKRKIRAVLIGGAAMVHYGSDRRTTDVDFAATAPLRRGQSIAPKGGVVIGKSFEEPGGVVVDWIVRRDEYSRLYEEAVKRAVPTDTGYSVVSPEYLVAMKLAANRPKDREDALWLLGQKGLVNRGQARGIVHRLLGGQFAAERLDRWFSIADWRRANGEESDPGEDED